MEEGQHRPHVVTLGWPLRQSPPNIVDDLVEVVVCQAETHEEKMVCQQMCFDQGGEGFPVAVVAKVVVARQDYVLGPADRSVEFQQPAAANWRDVLGQDGSRPLGIATRQFEESVIVQRDCSRRGDSGKQRGGEAVPRQVHGPRHGFAKGCSRTVLVDVELLQHAGLIEYCQFLECSSGNLLHLDSSAQGGKQVPPARRSGANVDPRTKRGHQMARSRELAELSRFGMQLVTQRGPAL